MLPFSDEELYAPVRNSLDRVRPMLLRDSGDIELVRITDGRVYVRLLGACSGCGAAHTTLKNGVEKRLRHDIHPEIQVFQELES